MPSRRSWATAGAEAAARFRPGRSAWIGLRIPRYPRGQAALSGRAICPPQRSLRRRLISATTAGRDDVHVLQIEIARALYMDEARIERLPAFPAIQQLITDLVESLRCRSTI